MAFYGWLKGDKERNSWKLMRGFNLFHWICNPMLIKFGICNPVPINVDYKSTKTNQRIANPLKQKENKKTLCSLCLNNLLLSNYFPKLAT